MGVGKSVYDVVAHLFDHDQPIFSPGQILC